MMTNQATNQKKKKRRVSNCRKSENETKCLGKYALAYDNSAPVFVCDTCGDRELTWKKFYDEYLQLFKIKENWDSDKDKVTCVIGFFCHMYKELYTTDYVFVPKNPNPYSSKECKDAWTLLATFKNDASEVRRYIYWLFKKVIRQETNLSSFGYLNTPTLIRKYKIQAERKNVYTRSSKLPESYLQWCKENVASIFDKYALDTMNDLGALYSYVKEYSDELGNDSIEQRAILKAEQAELIKDGKLKVG